MAASYHADYATILADPADLPAVGGGARRQPRGCPRPAATAAAPAWDVRGPAPLAATTTRPCPSSRPPSGPPRRRRLGGAAGAGGRLPGGDAARRRHLGRLPRDAGQEGPPRDPAQDPPRGGGGRGPLQPLPPLDAETVDGSSTLHQARWGADGLFPDTEGGDRCRRFLHRLTELEAAEGPRRDAPARAWSTWASGSIFASGGVRRRPDLLLLQRGHGPRGARALAGGRRAPPPTSGTGWRPAGPGSTSCAATSPTSTSGAPWMSPSTGSSCYVLPDDERAAHRRPLPGVPVRACRCRRDATDRRRAAGGIGHQRRRPGARLRRS